MFTLTYLTATGTQRTLTFYTPETYAVALTMCEAGGLVVVGRN